MEYTMERGKQLYKAKRYALALREFKSIDQDPAENPEVAYYIGLCYTQLEQWDQALFYLEQVINSEFSFMHNYQCRMVLGYIYSVTGRYKLAEYEFKKLTEFGMESTQVFASLGYVAYSQRRVEESIDYLQQALAIKPEYANALNSLGYIYAEEEIDIPKAITLCRKAVQQQPDNPAYLDSLGWAYYKAGRLEQSGSCLRKALDLQPGDKEIAGHMRVVIKA